MNPTIRNAATDDAELIAQLTREAWINKPADSSGHRESREVVLKSLSEGEAMILELAGQAIGSVRIYPVSRMLADGTVIGPIALEIARLGIIPAYRGRGLSSWLMNAVTLRAAAQGIEELRLAVRSDEPELQAFYQRHGFFADDSIVYSHANPNSPKPMTMRKYLYQQHPSGGHSL
jgi:ribosomal protein S18 acetylase RimI-like enzyme